MKIQCDVCNKDEASVFCVADEAALCDGCDHTVHHANKLAWKHQRFSLLKPSPNEVSMCDICREKRAFLFCQQDRAILCKDCDIVIHKANEYTKNHNRFLLTGVKLSPVSNIYLSPPKESDLVPIWNKSEVLAKSPISACHKISNPPSVPIKVGALTSAEKVCTKSSNIVVNPQQMNVTGGCNKGLTSSISEYLMENIPGWHLDDFLDSSISAPSAILKNGENDITPFWDDGLEENLKSFSSENMGIWVPQPPISNQLQPDFPPNITFGAQICLEEPKQLGTRKAKTSRKWRDDEGFTVPQISPSYNYAISKRSRTLW